MLINTAGLMDFVDFSEQDDESINAIIKQQKDTFLGFPEKLFVRINAIFPRLVDLATHSQNQQAKQYLSH